MTPSQFPGQTLAPIPGISGGEDQFSNIQKINQLLFDIVAAGGFGPSGITQLTGDGTAGPGSGSQALVVTKSNGVAFGSGAFATAIAPGGADQSIQYNSGGTALGGLTGMTATAGALTGISFTGTTQCTTFKSSAAFGTDDIFNTTLAAASGMRIFTAANLPGGNAGLNFTDGSSNPFFQARAAYFGISPAVVDFQGLSVVATPTVNAGYVTISVGGTPTKFLTG